MSELIMEPVAHIFSNQIEKLETTECVVEAFSIAMGSPDDRTVPFYSQSQVDQLNKRITELDQQLKTAKADGVREFAVVYEFCNPNEWINHALDYANNLEGK